MAVSNRLFKLMRTMDKIRMMTRAKRKMKQLSSKQKVKQLRNLKRSKKHRHYRKVKLEQNLKSKPKSLLRQIFKLRLRSRKLHKLLQN